MLTLSAGVSRAAAFQTSPSPEEVPNITITSLDQQQALLSFTATLAGTYSLQPAGSQAVPVRILPGACPLALYRTFSI